MTEKQFLNNLYCLFSRAIKRALRKFGQDFAFFNTRKRQAGHLQHEQTWRRLNMRQNMVRLWPFQEKKNMKSHRWFLSIIEAAIVLEVVVMYS